MNGQVATQTGNLQYISPQPIRCYFCNIIGHKIGTCWHAMKSKLRRNPQPPNNMNKDRVENYKSGDQSHCPNYYYSMPRNNYSNRNVNTRPRNQFGKNYQSRKHPSENYFNQYGIPRNSNLANNSNQDRCLFRQ